MRTSYLHRSGQLSRAEILVKEGEDVLVIGAGNVGMDTARTAMRLGAKSVTVVYSGRVDTIPALEAEYIAVKQEGVVVLCELRMLFTY